MGKYLSIIIGMACFLGACRSSQMSIEGEVEGWEEDQIYLGEVVHEANRFFNFIDTAVVVNGKFTFVRDSMLPELLYVGDRWGKGDFFFAAPGKIKLKAVEGNKEGLNWEVQGSQLDKLYRNFLHRRDEVCGQKVLDSLDQLFYAARDRQDESEMARIKQESQPFYTQAEQAEEQFVREQIEQYKEAPLGIYLYYTKVFGRKTFSTLQDIDQERQYITGFGADALASSYKKKMERQLDLYAGCAIGAIAPEISGQDTSGNLLKLSDLRGKYVLVDFWNSYCHWCREETVWLKKALETFKDKNFTILGVSNDRKQDLWLKAIREDGSHWEHLLLSPKDKIRSTYCIKGIPHIILVGPDGKILAKNLRHEELTKIPAQFMK